MNMPQPARPVSAQHALVRAAPGWLINGQTCRSQFWLPHLALPASLVQ